MPGRSRSSGPAVRAVPLPCALFAPSAADQVGLFYQEHNRQSSTRHSINRPAVSLFQTVAAGRCQCHVMAPADPGLDAVCSSYDPDIPILCEKYYRAAD